jgi:hypothetical protein
MPSIGTSRCSKLFFAYMTLSSSISKAMGCGCPRIISSSSSNYFSIY